MKAVKQLNKLYYNGKVYTGKLPLAEAFVVCDDIFIYAGSNEEAERIAGTDSEKTDLCGRFVCAGFNDSHMHLLGFGNSLRTADLSAHTRSLEDMVRYFADFAGKTDAKWLVGRGWNQDYFADADRMPNRHDLDRVSKTRPVVAVRCCGHALVVNSVAIEMLGVTCETPVPDGGSIGMENGQPDGRFFDNAMELVYSGIPAPGIDEVKDMIRRGCRALNAYGVTSCQSDDFSTFANLDPDTVIRAYRELEEAGELTVRVYEQSNIAEPEKLRGFIKDGGVTGSGSYYFKFGPLKLLGDGALGARTAYLSKPYVDDPTTSGLPVFRSETIKEMVGIAHRAGMQCAVHAIGDKCLDWVLDAFEAALEESPRRDHRHGVVHCQISRPDQLERMIRLGVHVYAQTIFIDYDSRIVRDRVGDELADSSYNWKTLMKGGISVSNGTDSPVEKPDALRGIQCAVTRRSVGSSDEPYLPDQAFTVQEALDSYTVRGAEASFEEGIKGRIAPGMLADFVVLQDDPFTTDPEKINEIAVCAAYTGGREVYRNEKL